MREGNAIEVNNITKSFKIYLDKGNTIKEKILFKNRRCHEKRQVLRGISFEVKEGEVVGLIGHNGCGKSTTLKLLTRIMYPDSGTIESKGRISSLLELGAGFHPDMSGRENIYINASIFGLSKKEIDERLDDIIEFSELEKYIDNPVRTYSSGMYMRLAFSVAINVDASILLIDEILAVGDVNFQSKCFDKMREIKESGVTIVLVTHDIGTVEWFCDRAIWINNGLIEKDGPATEVVDAYMQHMVEKKVEAIERRHKDEEKEESEEESEKKPEENRIGTREAEITNVYFTDSVGNTIHILHNQTDCAIHIDYFVEESKEYVIGIGILTMEGVRLFGTNTQLDRSKIDITPGNHMISFIINNLPLIEGMYVLQVAITDQNGALIDFHRDYMHFNVASKVNEVGYISFKHGWDSINKED